MFDRLTHRFLGFSRTKSCRSHHRLGHYETLEPRCLLAANPVITEFMADNRDALLDGDGAASDWIEIFNAGDEAIDLAGWQLVDGATAWPFPTRVLGSGEYLVVFASGQTATDYVDAGGNLHTNFALAAAGEYLALLRPDASIANEFAPAYPAQRENVSFGLEMMTTRSPLVEQGAAAATLIPQGPVVDWKGGDEPFDDSGWTDGDGATTGIGFTDAPAGPEGLLVELTFETSEGLPVADGMSAIGVVDETAGDEFGPYTGVGSGAASSAAGLAYSADVPAAISAESSHSLALPTPENPANHVAIGLDATHPIAMLPQGDFRIEAWFQTTDTGRAVLVGTHTPGAQTAISMELHTENRGRIYLNSPSAVTDLNLTLPTPSRDGQWHHLAGVREGNVLRLFYDGEEVGSMADASGPFTDMQPTIYLGRDGRTDATVFAGKLDDVRFYSSADTSSPVAAYDFETKEGVLTVDGQSALGVIDDSGQHADGPLHGNGFSVLAADGINYSADVPGVLTDSSFSLVIDESNTNAETVSLGMPQPIANLTQGDFTLQTWFKTTDVGRSVLMGSYMPGVDPLNFELHTNNRLRLYLLNQGIPATDLNLELPTDSRDGEWHSATGVRRGDVVELYYDGEFVGSRTDASGPYTQDGPAFYVGRDSRTDATRFDGQLDNVRMWNVALTPEQIGSMAAGATPIEVASSEFLALIENNVETEMLDINASALVRIPFQVADPQSLTSLQLSMRYDDGFVAYINGHEVARSNTPETIEWNSAALEARGEDEPLDREVFGLVSLGDLLASGTNILAIQGLNAAADDSDFLLVPELTGVSSAVVLGSHRFFTEATPGEPNENGVIDFVADTQFSADRGFYEAADLAIGGVLANGILIVSETPGATIVYTTDGSQPTLSNGTVVPAADAVTPPSASVAIATTTTLRAAAFKDEFAPTNVDTHTYVFLDDVLRQPAAPAGFPAEWQAGFSADYEMDPGVVDDPLYADRIKAGLLSIPSMSVVMDIDDLFSQASGIYSNSLLTGDAWERAMSLEFIDPNDPAREFQIDSAARMHGKGSRFPDRTAKHNFRALFKEPFGQTKLEFPLFDGSPVESFDTLLLRAGYNYTWNHNSEVQRVRAQYLRDGWMRDTFGEMGQLTARGDYVHLYVNGLYWGVYQTNERPDASFLAQHLGGDKADYDALNGDKSIDGDTDAWEELLALVREDLTVDANYQAALEMVDVDNLIDFLVVQFYGGNLDWPVSEGQVTNYYAGRERVDGAKFQFFVWDAEHVNYDLNVNITGVSHAGTVAEIYARLRTNPEFNLRFADRAQQHLFNDGPLTPENTAARYQQSADKIQEALIAESARWGDQDGQAVAHTVDNEWAAELDWQINTYFPQRGDIVLGQFRAGGLFPAIDAPSYFVNGSPQHGGIIDAGDLLSLTHNQDAPIYYTLDGTDPRLPGGGISPMAMLYDATIPLQSTTRVLSRALAPGNEWSALSEATYQNNPAVAGKLVISEVNYHPVDPTVAEIAAGFNSAERFEFIELLNTSDAPISLDGVRFVDGIGFTFGSESLDPGQRIVIVHDIAAFAARYGTEGIVVAGEWDAVTSGGDLKNGGEQILLIDAFGTTIVDFEYEDTGDWPSRADGDGSSLELVAADADATLAGSWRPSSEFGGSPGRAGVGPRSDIVVNEIIANTDLPQTDSIELHNTTAASIDISGWYLSDTSGDYRKFRIPAGTVIPAGGYRVFDESDFNSSQGASPNDFALSGSRGEEVYLLEADDVGQLVSFVQDIEFAAANNGEAFARWPNGSGDALYPMTASTLGAENSKPRVGPVVISEIMYAPIDPDGVGGIDPDNLEFVEIFNPTDKQIALANWRLRGGGDFEFDSASVLAPGGVLVIVPFDPVVEAALLSDFRSTYGIDDTVVVVGPFRGQLGDVGDTVRLERPGQSPFAEPDFIPRITEDQVSFTTQAPWPAEAGGGGSSLHRAGSNAWGIAADSWNAAAPTPGNYVEAAVPLRVLTASVTPSGVDLHLLRDLDSTLLNLFDGQDAAIDPADVMLVGDLHGPVQGSLAWDVERTTLSFVATGQPLPPDQYTLTIASRADGAVDRLGRLLDGDSDAEDGGDFIFRFQVKSTAAPLISLPDFARGSGQLVELNGTNGIPVSLSNGTGVTEIEFLLRYDPSLLHISDIERGSGLPDDWIVTDANSDTPGEVFVSARGDTPVESGVQEVFILAARVLESEPRDAGHALRFDHAILNGGNMAVVKDQAIHVAAYLGDTTGDGRYSGLDASYIARVAVGLDTGFDSMDQVDPVIVGDVTGNGRLSALDASFVARKAVDLEQPEIPDLPPLPSPLPAPIVESRIAGIPAPPHRVLSVQLPVMQQADFGGERIESASGGALAEFKDAALKDREAIDASIDAIAITAQERWESESIASPEDQALGTEENEFDWIDAELATD